MKIITLLLMTLSIGVAQAKVYKCPGKMEGQYTYQERPCKGAKPDEHTLKIIPADEKKIAEAQAQLAKEINAAKEKESPTAKTTTPANTTPTVGSPQSTNNGATNATNSTSANSVPTAQPPAPQPTPSN